MLRSYLRNTQEIHKEETHIVTANVEIQFKLLKQKRKEKKVQS